MYILFPSSYLNHRKVDEAFQKEYDTAFEAGFMPVLFNQKLWDEHRTVSLNMYMCTKEPVIYRGWMMKPEEYKSFYNFLKTDILSNPSITLLTSPEKYNTMHCFPYTYEQVKEDTPKIMTFPLHSKIDVETLKKNLGKFIIKDYVKSAKNTNFPAYFDENITQEEFDKWLDRFYEIRGNLFTGGVVAKEFVNLKKYDNHVNEYRVFYANGEPISISRNSLQPFYAPEVTKDLIQKYKNLPSPFYTVDFAEKEDGRWIIIETGDGGVSGLSEEQNYEAFYRALYTVLEKEKYNEPEKE